MMLQQFRVKLFQLVELREYLGTRVVGLDSGLLALIEKVSMRVSNRVFHENTFSKKEIVHTPTTPYRAYINHIQKLVFLGTDGDGFKTKTFCCIVSTVKGRGSSFEISNGKTLI